MPSQTTDHNIPFAVGTDSANTIDDTMEALAERVDQIIVTHDAGTLAARPVSTPESPGIAGRDYRISTGEGAGIIYRDTGTGWIAIGRRPAGEIAGSELEDLGVTADKLADAEKLGLTDGSTVRRGKSIIAASESRTNTAYGVLATPDRVSGIVLPTDGLILIDFLAIWECSVADAGRAAIFIGENQLKVERGLPAPVTQAAWLNTVAGSAGVPTVLGTAPLGLVSAGTADVVTGDPVSTGQVVGASPVYSGNIEAGGVPISVADLPIGGSLKVFAAAGTYDVSVRFKSASGSVTAKHRKLWVRTEAF